MVHGKKINYATILAAKNGDAAAMQSILRHYKGYIAYYSKSSYFDADGTARGYIDDDIAQQIEAKLMYQIIMRFDPYRLPDGEVLEEE